MTFQQILDMVRDTAKAVNPTGTFIHGRNSDAANAQSLPYTRIHLYPFTQDYDPTDTHKRTTQLLMAFVDKDSGAQDQAEREDIINRMNILTDEFLANLEVEFVSDVEFSALRSEPQYQVFEGMSGYSFRATIKSQVGC